MREDSLNKNYHLQSIFATKKCCLQFCNYKNCNYIFQLQMAIHELKSIPRC
jgi:hypothetical protein